MRLPLLSLSTGVLADARIDGLEAAIQRILEDLGEERQEDDDRIREFLQLYFLRAYKGVKPNQIPGAAEAVMRAYNMHKLFGMERGDDGNLLDPDGESVPLQLAKLEDNSDKMVWGQADAKRRLSESSSSYEEFESDS